MYRHHHPNHHEKIKIYFFKQLPVTSAVLCFLEFLPSTERSIEVTFHGQTSQVPLEEIKQLYLCSWFYGVIEKYNIQQLSVLTTAHNLVCYLKQHFLHSSEPTAHTASFQKENHKAVPGKQERNRIFSLVARIRRMLHFISYHWSSKVPKMQLSLDYLPFYSHPEIP